MAFRSVAPLGVPETTRPQESPRSLVKRLALSKALAVAARHPGHWVLGCDTEVALGRRVLGKPKNPQAAREMIHSLSNRSHQVLSGLALVGPGGQILFRDCVASRVSFGPIPPAELQAYLKTREPYDKAGGYGIQGTARRWVTSLEGDYFNVMGLPVSRVLEALIRHGLWQKRH